METNGKTTKAGLPHSRRAFMATTAASTALLAFPYIAHAKSSVVLKAAHASSNTSTGQQAFEYMASNLDERTDGRIKMDIFPNAQLGSEREEVESVQLGNLDMTFISSAVLGAFDKRFFALDVPFMFKDRPTVFKVLDGDIGDSLLDNLAQKNLKGLAYWENGFRQLTNNKRPIHSPADLEGMKMRTMENDIHIAAWRALGANASPLAFGELFTALQQGTFDAQEGPINLFYDVKFFEVQKYITRTNHVYSAWPLLINPKVYEKFSDADRDTFDAVVNEATELQRKLAAEADDQALAKMPEVELLDLSDEELLAFSSKMGPILDMAKEKAGAEIVDQIVAMTA